MAYGKRQREDRVTEQNTEDEDGREARRQRQSQTVLPRFTCTFEGCSKAYSRAEHLERHQLNHAPKEIFYCKFPDCKRWFVREDLRARHHERHERRNSRASVSQHQSNVDRDAQSPSGERVQGPDLHADEADPDRWTGQQLQNPLETTNAPRLEEPSNATTFVHDVQHGEAPFARPSQLNGDHQPLSRSQNSMESRPWPTVAETVGHSNVSQTAQAIRPTGQSDTAGYADVDVLRSRHAQTIPGGTASASVQRGLMQDGRGASARSVSGSLTEAIDHTGLTPISPPFQAPRRISRSYMPSADQPFSESPLSIRDEFTAWLFDDIQGAYNSFNALGGEMGMGSGALPFTDPFSTSNMPPYLADPLTDNQYGNMLHQQLTLEKRQDFADDNSVSPERRRYLIEHMHLRFNEDSEPSDHQSRKNRIFSGDHDSDTHIFSLRLMRSYVRSYWQNFHNQLPILHQPTFSTELAPDLLLLALVMIGASLLSDHEHEVAVTAGAQDLANFIAWHLRWQLYMHREFHPPKKLWIFQTLLLLEVYEKMNSTRALHERANIHYATTISLMRRSNALDEDLSLGQHPTTTPQEWWERWIKAEATRRVVYAAFLLDASHANMFGHTAAMVIQEIRLPLPCDEALWSATSPAEVGLVERSLHANGIRPTTFLQGLKRTLTGHRVRTNSFGRLALIAGLLSVSWHMRQREVQTSTLGMPNALAVPDTWRPTLVRAFDFWKHDFDEDQAHMRRAPSGWHFPGAVAADNDAVRDYATVLHHLSQMTMHVEITECQIAAGAKMLLGRSVTQSEHARVEDKMEKWRRSVGASRAAYHAIQMLHTFLIRASSTSNGGFAVYKARDDTLLPRPWGLYFAALVLWCFTYEGRDSRVQESSTSRTSLPFVPKVPNFQVQRTDAHARGHPTETQAFLRKISSRSSEELASLPSCQHEVSKLLELLADSFDNSRWQLLHEAADRLRNAITISSNT